MLDSGSAPDDAGDGGWAFVATTDGAAKLLGTLVGLNADRAYTRSDLAERSGVPLKTLYLEDLLGEFVELGVVVRAEPSGDGDGEPRYRPADDSDLLSAARAFEAAFDDAD